MPDDSIVHASRSQRERTSIYMDELYRWNRRMNLTSIPAEEAAPRHTQEAAELLDRSAPARAARVVDVGAGAGVPGVLLAIFREDLHVDLVEADARKAAFLDHVAGLLGLEHVRVLVRRAEDVARDSAHRETYDLAVSRAAAEPRALCELALPLVRPGGRLCALVRDAPAAAAACSGAAASLGGLAPEARGPHVLEVFKASPTDARYPRRGGLWQRRPLG